MKRFARFYRIRKKKKPIFRSRFFWLFILILMILSGVFYLVSFSSFFQVKEIEISGKPKLETEDFQLGKQKVSFEDIQGLVEKTIEQKILFLGAPWEGGGWVVVSKSIFLVNLDKIRERILNEFPQIANVNLKRNFPDKITIQIEERKPIAIFCQQLLDSENCFLIDGEGIIIDSVIENNFEFPKILGSIDSPELGKKVIERNYLETILEIQKKLAEEKIKIKEFEISEKKLTAFTSENWQIFFDPLGDISDQILNLTALLKEKIPPENRENLEYIDLRFSKIYYKYR